MKGKRRQRRMAENAPKSPTSGPKTPKTPSKQVSVKIDRDLVERVMRRVERRKITATQMTRWLYEELLSRPEDEGLAPIIQRIEDYEKRLKTFSEMNEPTTSYRIEKPAKTSSKSGSESGSKPSDLV